MANQVYTYVTNRIIEQLEKGVIPWQRPWINGRNALNYVSRKPYTGINTLLLDRPGEYLTFKQIEKLGGKVKKGAKSEMVVFYKPISKNCDGAEELTDQEGAASGDEDGSNKTRKTYFLLRYSE